MSSPRTTGAGLPAPRRRIVRPAATPPTAPNAAGRRRLDRLHARLAREQTALDRWWRRLRRALNAVDKLQKSTTRLRRQLAGDGGTHHEPHD